MVDGAADGDHVRGGGRRSTAPAAMIGRGGAGLGPFRSGAHPGGDGADGEAWGGRTAASACASGGGRRWRRKDGDGDCGRHGPIPSAWRCSTARR